MLFVFSLGEKHSVAPELGMLLVLCAGWSLVGCFQQSTVCVMGQRTALARGCSGPHVLPKAFEDTELVFALGYREQ